MTESGSDDIHVVATVYKRMDPIRVFYILFVSDASDSMEATLNRKLLFWG